MVTSDLSIKDDIETFGSSLLGTELAINDDIKKIIQSFKI